MDYVIDYKFEINLYFYWISTIWFIFYFIKL